MANPNDHNSDSVEKKVKESSEPIVRASIVQASTVIFDTPATIEKAERFIAEAAKGGAKLVVFPETYVGGYLRGLTFSCSLGEFAREGGEQFRKYRESAITVPGPEVDRLAGFARTYKVYLVMGVVEKDGYTLYNTVIFFDPQGSYMGKHRKLMPTCSERIVWGFGDGSLLPVFDTPVGKIGSVICWENRMPLLRTAMYAKGVEIYCAPTADESESWQSTMRHIAQEGGCFVLGACQYYRRKDLPPEPEYEFRGVEKNIVPDSVISRGGSVIISPFGDILAGPNFEGEGLVTADLDLREIARAKFTFDVVGHYSRGDVFNLTVNEKSNYPVSFGSTATEAKTVVQGTNHK